MKSLKTLIWELASIFSAIIILFNGCKCGTEPHVETVDEYIKSIQLFPEPPEYNNTLLSEKINTEVREDSAEYGCTVKEYNLENNAAEVVAINPHVNVVWPGALVQGRTLAGGAPAIISLPRGPINLTIDLAKANKPSTTIENPQYSTVQPAINKLLMDNAEATNQARLSKQIKYAYSSKQASIEVSISPSWLGLSNVNFKFDQETKKKSIIVKFIQTYYQIACDPPKPSSASFFAPSVTVAQLGDYASDGNPPMYISSVSYGRMLLFRMSSDSSHQKMETTIETKLSGGKLTIEQQYILSHSTIEIAVIGGDPINGTEVITGLDIDRFINAGATWRPEAPGLPIAYAVNYLKDNQLAKVGFSTQYTTKDCSIKQQPIKITFEKILVHHDCEDRGQGEFYYEFKANGKIIADLNSRTPISVDNNAEIPINKTGLIYITKRQNESIVISGKVVEKDNIGTDELPPFQHEYFYKNNLSPVDATAYLRKDGACDVTVFYHVDFNP